MNTYIVSFNIRGKTGRTYGIPIVIEALNKDDAKEKARKLIEEDGFTISGIDYIDLAD